MNRAERRRNKNLKPEPTYNIKKSEIQSIKSAATSDAVDAAFALMLCIPVWVLHDNFGKLMKKEGREQLFTDLLFETYDCFKEGRISFEDLITTLKEEANVTIKGFDGCYTRDSR